MNIPKHLKKVKEVNWTKEQLDQFELDAKKEWESGKVLGPVHLSKGNEEQLIEIFQYVHPDDWVFSTWRNHYHALLHGVPEKWLMDEIKRGRSMKITNKEHNFVISAIVGGIIPQALGVAMALKRKGSERRVWCFIGDMAFETGEFNLCYNFSKYFDLPLQLVVEDNNLSILTEKKVRRSWNIHEVAQGFGVKSFDVIDDPNDIDFCLSDNDAFKEPILLNINTIRKYWHAGAGIDDPNVFDRYEDEMKDLGQQAVDIHEETKIYVRGVWEEQLNQQ